MISSQHHQEDAGAVYRLEPPGYPPVALLDVAGDHRHVAVVYYRDVIEDHHVEPRVEAPEEVRDAPYALWSEAGADAEGPARVEGRPDDRGVGVLEVLDVGEAHERASPREARGLEGVCGLVSGHGSLLPWGIRRPARRPTSRGRAPRNPARRRPAGSPRTPPCRRAGEPRRWRAQAPWRAQRRGRGSGRRAGASLAECPSWRWRPRSCWSRACRCRPARL